MAKPGRWTFWPTPTSGRFPGRFRVALPNVRVANQSTWESARIGWLLHSSRPADSTIFLEALLSKPAVLRIHLSNNTERHIHGRINRFSLLEYGVDRVAAYENRGGPWPGEQGFHGRGFTDYEFRLHISVPEREYTIQ